MLVKMAHRQKHQVCSQHRIQTIYQIIISAQQAGFFFSIGSGIGKNKEIPGSESGLDGAGVLKCTIEYFLISFLLSGKSRYFRVY